MSTIRLLLEYHGSLFHGWQRQPGRRTVQGVLEAAAETVAGKPVAVTGAGRTDAGVHAKGQTAHFKTDSPLSAEVWMRALNGLLPEDVRVIRAIRAPADFHARHSATAKIYRYQILNRRFSSPLRRDFFWTVYSRLDIRSMRTAAKAFEGRQDFSSFQAAGHGSRSPICTIRRLGVERKGEEWAITIEGNRFLRQMVRNVVGTLIEVGRGRRKPTEMRDLIRARDRRLAGPTAPAHGLFLVKVLYAGRKTADARHGRKSPASRRRAAS